jgi:3-oxoacyl-[acyl-carrier-protein] synthase-1
MRFSPYIREAVAFCSLGNTPKAIVDAIHRENIPRYKELPFGSGMLRRQYQGMIEKNVTHNDEFYAVLEQLLSELIHTSKVSFEELSECALFIGSTAMNIPCSEPIYRSHPDQTMLPYIGYGVIGENLARNLGIGGEIALFTTACTSSANALFTAQAGINEGRFPRAIVLGFDFYNELTLSGFESFGLLSTQGCRPFDRERSGIVLGEGCAAILVDSVASNYDTQLILRGGASRCDISSPTAHNTDGVMVAQTILDALRDAEVSAADISLIKAHATGSEANDAAEGVGLRRVFASIPSVIAIKSSLGHTLGGCGVIELAALWFCMREGFIPKTFGFKLGDESIGLSPIAEEGLVQEGMILLNHFGFGGNGTVLVAEFQRGARK